MTGGTMAEEEIEYESDPEEAKLSLKMRRREASDDEAEEGPEIREKPPLRVDDSDGESEGAAAEYEDEFEEEEELEVYDLDEEYVEEVQEVGYGESGGARDEDSVKAVTVERDGAGTGGDGGVMAERMDEKKGVSNDTSKINDDENGDAEDGQPEGEKKEMELYAVPTAGAFYMHDDRFRDSAGRGNRRTLGGRRLWESKDDRKWGHDKFEELTLQERSYEERSRGSRGRYRGRGKNRTSGRGYARENSSHNNNNHNNAPKDVRGRGPRRYQQSFKNNEAPQGQNKQPGKSDEKPLHVTSVRTSVSSASTAEPDVVLPRKQVVSSSLNIASPPFYPSGSSTKDQSVPNKEDIQAGSLNRNGEPSVNSISAGKPGNNMQIPRSTNATQHQFKGQGRGIASSTRMVYQPTVSNNQLQTVQTKPVQSRTQSSGQQFTQRVPSVSQSSSPPKTAGNAFESTPELSKSKTELVPKGKGNMQGSGMAPFLYGGAQFMGASGNISSGQGDQNNFPAFMQFMQLGGQHPGGMGVPAVGMAFPGYVGQPQLGRGNSEMTWLPVLAGPAGSLGASYCPPYIGVDGSFNARPSGQTSSITSVSSKESNSTNVSNDWKSAQKPELANDDYVQRQKNPRRYTEMKFDQ